MATNLNQLLERLRRDLGDTDPTNARWANDDLERHLRHALRELSREIPRELKATLSTTASSRDIDISSLTDRLQVLAVEWPTGNYPPTYVRFSLWRTTLTLLVTSAPSAVENVNVFWHALHLLDPETSTIPEWAEDLLALGAAGYAAREWASQAANQVNLGGSAVFNHYLQLGTDNLAAFHKALLAHGRQGSLRTSRLYVPERPRPTQSSDPGPP